MPVSVGGGLAEGLQKGFGIGGDIRTRQYNERLLSNQIATAESEKKAKEKDRITKEFNDNITQVMELAQQLSTAYGEGKYRGTPEQFQSTLNAFIDRAAMLSQLA